VDSDGEKDRNQGIPPLQLILQPLDKWLSSRILQCTCLLSFNPLNSYQIITLRSCLWLILSEFLYFIGSALAVFTSVVKLKGCLILFAKVNAVCYSDSVDQFQKKCDNIFFLKVEIKSQIKTVCVKLRNRWLSPLMSV
jgi:hypothetical protein